VGAVYVKEALSTNGKSNPEKQAAIHSNGELKIPSVNQYELRQAGSNKSSGLGKKYHDFESFGISQLFTPHHQRLILAPMLRPLKCVARFQCLHPATSNVHRAPCMSG
jgi:hypothetical protein